MLMDCTMFLSVFNRDVAPLILINCRGRTMIRKHCRHNYFVLLLFPYFYLGAVNTASFHIEDDMAERIRDTRDEMRWDGNGKANTHHHHTAAMPY